MVTSLIYLCGAEGAAVREVRGRDRNLGLRGHRSDLEQCDLVAPTRRAAAAQRRAAQGTG